MRVIFLSTPSARRATTINSMGVMRVIFLSTPSARRATMSPCQRETSIIDFYPRPPRGGRRMAWQCFYSDILFLSTPSARRATTALCKCILNAKFLSTPSARRATNCSNCHVCDIFNFYPRPPRGGRLPAVLSLGFVLTDFYPRPPRGGRLSSQLTVHSIASISIHALREEGDA